MDQIPSLDAALIGLVAVALAYSSVPKIRRLERRVAELERQAMGKASTQ